MGLSTRLCNATPWEQIIPWGRTRIIVPGDGHVEVTPAQLEDYRPGLPGSEEVQALLTAFGCFLYDTDRSYDIQIYEALQKTVKAKKQQYTDFVAALRNDRIKAGQNNVNEEELESVIEMQGYSAFRSQTQVLEKRLEKLRKILGAAGDLNRNRQAPKYDPERTCFGTSPPREFPSKLALEIFLEENPEAAAKHEVFITNMNKAAKKTKETEAAA